MFNDQKRLAAEGAPGASRRTLAGICAALVALVFAVFGRTYRFGFVYDDIAYILNNHLVQKGLTVRGILWSFTYGEIGHWHPVTWMSHMLDCQLYGLWAGGHHITNVILHAIAVVLLFLVLFQMTGALWRSAFAAAAWAIHPLRVESVAWIAERKDVLSGVFFMLALAAYLHWLHQRKSSRYALLTILFALGLMSKNMLVTFPCVLLLFDYWPLGRLQYRAQFAALVKEKIPLFILSFASCLITFLVPEKVNTVSQLPLWLRIENVFISYCIYLRQGVWPVDLSVDYPVPTRAFPLWEIAGALALLGFISAAVFASRKSRPYLITGWLWFIGMLMPVIGFVQIAHYAHADRYTYLPQIGLWIAGTWLVVDLAQHWKNRRPLLGALAAAILCALSVTACHQVSFWRDHITLWTHVLACNENDALAHNNLGFFMFKTGRIDDAISHFQEGIRIDPHYAVTRYNLGLALDREGRTGEAIAKYRETLQIDPAYPGAHNNLGNILARQGHTDDAIAEYREAIRIDPDDAGAQNNLGNVLLGLRKTDDAVTHFREALRIAPTYAEARNNLGNALILQGHTDEAIVEYREAVRIDPGYANARYNLGTALLRTGQGEEAIGQFEKALELQPGNADYQNVLALVLATAPRENLRNGPRALALATQANASAGGSDPMVLRTLAAAYAETGKFPDAVETARKALQLAETRSNAGLATALSRELKLYEAGRRFENPR